jgi:hypothetical protein
MDNGTFFFVLRWFILEEASQALQASQALTLEEIELGLSGAGFREHHMPLARAMVKCLWREVFLEHWPEDSSYALTNRGEKYHADHAAQAYAFYVQLQAGGWEVEA